MTDDRDVHSDNSDDDRDSDDALVMLPHVKLLLVLTFDNGLNSVLMVTVLAVEMSEGSRMVLLLVKATGKISGL